ncbi:hypothetical protein SCALM49S_08457 [Streptomyces californicus]
MFDKPFFLILNLAVGGYWPGDPDGSTRFPQQMVIDYVRVTTGDSPPARRAPRALPRRGRRQRCSCRRPPA